MRSDSIFSNSRFLGGAALALAVLFAIVSLHFRFSTYINHDVAWYLYSAGRLLDGGRMYQDMFVDVNPPLALYLTVPPVYLARLTGMFSVDIFIAYLCVLVLASLTSDDGCRSFAVHPDPALLESVAREELCGREARVADGRFELA